MTINEIFKKLESTNSVKDKQAILEANKSNKLLESLLEANLNPHKLYQFNKMPTYSKTINVSSRPIYLDFLDLLDRLNNRAVTGHAARDEVIEVFSRMTEEESELYEKILLKSPIGVGTKTVNKVWPDLIPEFKVMLAPSQLPNLTQLKYPLYVQPKYDGFRCIYYAGYFWTREGNPFSNQNIPKYFKCLEGMQDYVLDGELYAHKSVFNNLQKTLNAHDKPLPPGLKYYVYDCITTKDWEAEKSNVTYEDRLKDLRELLNNTIADYNKVIDAPTDLVQDSSEVIDIYKKYLKNGYEGVMLKAPLGKYQWKRVTLKSGEMIKVKPFKTEDLEVTGVYDGEGKFEGTTGGIIVNYNGTSVRVGSGLDDATRDAISKNPNSYIGKTAEIKFFEETEDGSLRHPIFERWREDK